MTRHEQGMSVVQLVWQQPPPGTGYEYLWFQGRFYDALSGRAAYGCRCTSGIFRATAGTIPS